MDKETRFLVTGEIYSLEYISDNLYAKWFGDNFVFNFSKPIKKIKFYYKNINLHKTLVVSNYEFKNLPEEGWVETYFSEPESVIKCTCPTYNPYKSGLSSDNRNLGIYIINLEFTDLFDVNYVYKIQEVPCISDEISKIFNINDNIGNNVYYHCGDYGDIIYSLPVIKSTGGGILYLGNQLKCDPERCPPRELITVDKFNFLKPLLEIQPYIKEVIYTDKYPENVTHDLNKFRKMFIKTKNDLDDFPNGANLSLLDAPLLSFDIDLQARDKPWLDIKNNKIFNKKIIINRTERVRNYFGESDEAYKYIVKNFKEQSVFIGSEEEYHQFIETYGYVDRYIINDAQLLAQLIDQAYFFVGNSSFPFAISEGLKKQSYFEIRDDHFKHTKYFREGHHRLEICNVTKLKIPNIYHIVSLYQPNDLKTIERLNSTFKSWETLYSSNENIIPVHIHEHQYPRNTKSVGDTRKCAFLKDLIKIGYDKCQSDDDIVMFTNDDTILSPYIGSKIFDKIVKYQACKSFRINLKEYDQSKNIELYNVIGKDGGRDMFAMTKRWIRRNIGLIPDYALGSTDWDFYMALLIQFTNGIWLSKQKNDQKCETDIELGHVFHIYHDAPWQKISAANHYNRQLTKEFLNKLGFIDEFKDIDYDKYKSV